MIFLLWLFSICSIPILCAEPNWALVDQRAQNLFEAKQYEECKQYYQELLSQPTASWRDKVLLYNLGTNALAQERFSEAAQYWNGLELDVPQEERLRYNQALLYAKSADSQESDFLSLQLSPLLNEEATALLAQSGNAMLRISRASRWIIAHQTRLASKQRTTWLDAHQNQKTCFLLEALAHLKENISLFHHDPRIFEAYRPFFTTFIQSLALLIPNSQDVSWQMLQKKASESDTHTLSKMIENWMTALPLPSPEIASESFLFLPIWGPEVAYSPLLKYTPPAFQNGVALHLHGPQWNQNKARLALLSGYSMVLSNSPYWTAPKRILEQSLERAGLLQELSYRLKRLPEKERKSEPWDSQQQIQKEIILRATPFLQSVVKMQKLQFQQESCKQTAWNPIIPLYLEGWHSLNIKQSDLILNAQENTVQSWLKAIQAFDQESQNPLNASFASSEAQELEEILRNDIPPVDSPSNVIEGW